ncbi:hypothetical protein GMRT_10156 [Giardia muris]|uniref:BRCA2 OB1 domain-containing protein n=1 Tax=Giardia muris TaxID=5742 RepID=A0A4Z1SPH3_GIAMU|nr:hypothetical protein GMRT_10156 [Giardia muris]|eukprot:TNJ26775.1 hypothetical protein GMRT_10156 [Giardia muris]
MFQSAADLEKQSNETSGLFQSAAAILAPTGVIKPQEPRRKATLASHRNVRVGASNSRPPNIRREAVPEVASHTLLRLLGKVWTRIVEQGPETAMTTIQPAGKGAGEAGGSLSCTPTRSSQTPQRMTARGDGLSSTALLEARLLETIAKEPADPRKVALLLARVRPRGPLLQSLSAYAFQLHAFWDEATRRLESIEAVRGLPPPILSPGVLGELYITARGETHPELCFPRFLAASQGTYNPYLEPPVGKQRAIARHTELGQPSFCKFYPVSSADAAELQELIPRLSYLYGTVAYPDPPPPAVGLGARGGATLERSAREYARQRQAYLTYLLSQSFKLCKSVAFLETSPEVTLEGGGRQDSLYSVDGTLLQANEAEGEEEVGESRYSGFVILPYTHDPWELLVCAESHTSVLPSCHFNATLSGHEDLIRLLHTEFIRYDDGLLTPNRLYLVLIHLGLRPDRCPYAWVVFQMQLAIFRLSRLQILLDSQGSIDPDNRTLLNPYSVLIHCMLKYAVEYTSVYRPILSLFARQDMQPGICTGVYLVLSVDEDSENQKQTLLLTDGFYLVRGIVSPQLQRYLGGKGYGFHPHEKVIVSMAGSEGYGTAAEPTIESDANVQGGLFLTYFNARKAMPGESLGRFRRPFLSLRLEDAFVHVREQSLWNVPSQQAPQVPHTQAIIVKIFDPIVYFREDEDRQVVKYRRVLVTTRSSIDTYVTQQQLGKDGEGMVEAEYLPCWFLRQYGAKADAYEELDPGLQIQLFGTGFGTYLTDLDIIQLRPSLVLYSRATASSAAILKAEEERLREQLGRLYREGRIALEATDGSLHPLRELALYFYGHGSTALFGPVHPLYGYALSTESQHLFHFYEILQAPRMAEVLVPTIPSVTASGAGASASEADLMRTSMMYRKTPPRHRKIRVRDCLLQPKGQGRFRVVCLDETQFTQSAEMFAGETEDQTLVYQALLDEAMEKYL